MLESLEGRQLLSGDAFMEANGRLVIRGTDNNDSIALGVNVSDASQLDVKVNGQSWSFKIDWVKTIKVEAGNGNDVVTSAGNAAATPTVMMLGAGGNDTLVSATGNDALIGSAGNDVIVAPLGSNYLNGGIGDDKIYSGSGNDTLIGEGGKDAISDAGGSNTVLNSPGVSVVTAAVPSVVAGINTGAPQAPSGGAPTPVPPPAPTPAPAPSPTPAPSSSSPFVIGVWSQPTYSFDKWKARGINTVVGYESLGGTVSVESFSQAAVNSGLYMIRHPNSDPNKDKSQKNLLAWMQNDEPDYHSTPASVLTDEYKALKAVDPSKPVFVNFSGSSALWGYGGKTQKDYVGWMAGADWISNDLYPITAHNRASALDAPGLAAQRLSSWSGGKRQFVVIEASDQELPGHADYPGVTADQFRAEVFNAVISGATGVIYFPQKIGGGFKFDYMNTQVEAEMKSVNARLTQIGSALMGQKDPSGVGMTVSDALKVSWRKYNGKTYFIVLNNSAGALTSTMTVNGVSAATAAVNSENRSVAIRNGQITDTFKPFEAHVYVVG